MRATCRCPGCNVQTRECHRICQMHPEQSPAQAYGPLTDEAAHEWALPVALRVGPAPRLAVALAGVGQGAQLQACPVVGLDAARVCAPVLVATAQGWQHCGVDPVGELLGFGGLGADPVGLVEVWQQDVLQEAGWSEVGMYVSSAGEQTYIERERERLLQIDD